MFQRAADWLWKIWYPLLSRRTRNAALLFLNYGYDDDNPAHRPALLPADEADRPCIQLYHRVAGIINLSGLNVLEVSCGHGGGATYIARYFKPRSLQAIDRNAQAVALCRARPSIEGVAFSVGNALALDFPDATFDAVINVEASHCYPDVPRFFAEVRRVLRPDGHFLYADFRDTGPPLELLRQQLKASAMEILACDDISAAVVRGMQRNDAKYLALIQQLVPRFLQSSAKRFAGVKDSAIYSALDSGRTVYLCCHLKKTATEIIPKNP